MKSAIQAVAGVLLMVFACTPVPEGLGTGPGGSGPVVVFDLEVKPLPQIPFPNDLATRLSSTSPTGKLLNLSLNAPTQLEEEFRERADQLDGFGTYAPISVSFDAPLYLPDLHHRHRDNRDFSDDAVLVIDVTKGSPTYGQPAFLDMGRGFFPANLKITDAYFANDPRSLGTNLLYESYTEAPGADTDADGVVDKPNVESPGSDPWDSLLTDFELETSTLIVRPVVPLRERTRYAVVLTRRLLGEKGTGDTCKADSECPDSGSCDPDAGRCREPVRSPFRLSHHVRQADDLAPLADILPREPFDLSMDDVSFAWTFTTQSVTSPLLAVRNGLYGEGPLSRLADEFPPAVRLVPAETAEKGAQTGSLFVVDIDEIMAIAGPLLPGLSGIIPSLAESQQVLIDSYSHVDFMVAGTYDSPDFLVDRDGMATPEHPASDDEVFELNPETGEAVYGTGKVPFVCIIPKEHPGGWKDASFPHLDGRAPFPVAIFLHGTASSKLQAMGFAGHFARLGIATCSIDAFAHGMPFPSIAAPGSIMSEANVRKMIDAFAPGYGPVYDIMKGTRARDLNMDGNLDPAGDFWTMDPFHTRDCIRQTAIDLVQFLRILRSMDGVLRVDVDGDGKEELFGDFNGDGQVDLGGPTNHFYAYGISLGGIVTSVFAGLDAGLDAAVVIVAGGGLADVAVRSTNPGVPEMAVMPALGPMLVGDRDAESGEMVLRFVIPVFDHTELLEVARLAKAAEGTSVRLTNLDSGESRQAEVGAEGTLRIQIAADAIRATELRHYTGFDPLLRLGGGSCTADADCDGGLPCRKGVCACNSEADCPEWHVCTPEAQCRMVPKPIDTTLETASHPALGDRFLLEVLDSKGKIIETVDQFETDVTVNGTIYPTGAPLVNLYRGYGNIRQTPAFRRFMGIAQTVLEPGDPVNWALRYGREPLAPPASDPVGAAGTNVLVLLGVGDTNVPVATGVSLARATGAVGYLTDDSRFPGKSEMEVLVDSTVVEGLFNRCRYKVPTKDKDGAAQDSCVLFDPDDLDSSRNAGPCTDCKLTYDKKGEKVTGWVCSDDKGAVCGDGFNAPTDLTEPVRAAAVLRNGEPVPAREAGACKRKNADGTCAMFEDPGGVFGLRFALTRPEGFHGLYLMAPYKPFDVETYQLNLIARYFMSGGTQLWDDPCLEDNSCPWVPQWPEK